MEIPLRELPAQALGLEGAGRACVNERGGSRVAGWELGWVTLVPALLEMGLGKESHCFKSPLRGPFHGTLSPDIM